MEKNELLNLQASAVEGYNNLADYQAAFTALHAAMLAEVALRLGQVNETLVRIATHLEDGYIATMNAEQLGR